MEEKIYDDMITITKILRHFTVKEGLLIDMVIVYIGKDKGLRCCTISYLLKKKSNKQILMDYINSLMNSNESRKRIDGILLNFIIAMSEH